MKHQTLKSDMLLMMTAIIWGFAFVAQRVGMEYIGPFMFNGIRFAIGSLSVTPLIILFRRQSEIQMKLISKPTKGYVVKAGILCGAALFTGASLQQIGIVHTTAGKAGFITGLYVIIVPIMGLFWKQIPEAGTWMGAAMAVVGLYFLSVTEHMTILYGDLLVLISAVCWAGHVLILGWLSPRINAFVLSFIQYATCSVLSLTVSFFTESTTFQGIHQAMTAILYGGLLSVGVAYTLQVVAQRDAPASHAAILLSLETVFAAIGGWLILDETLSTRGFIGCAFMLAGMLISQLHAVVNRKKHKESSYSI